MGQKKTAEEKQATKDARNARRRAARAAQKAMPAPAVSKVKDAGVEISQMAVGDMFTADGYIFKIHSFENDEAIADMMENTPLGVLVERWQKSFNLLTKVEPYLS